MPGRADGTEFSRERIEQLFARLDERIRARGISASLYVVGGAALAMGTMGRRLTRDIDVAYLDAAVAAEAEQLGREEGLPRDWLNSSAAPRGCLQGRAWERTKARA